MNPGIAAELGPATIRPNVLHRCHLWDLQESFSPILKTASQNSQSKDRELAVSTVTPGPTPNTVRAADGKVLAAPEDWQLLRPGDAALTRRGKAAGEHWTVQEKRGRKVFSRGVWAPAATIDRVRAEMEK